jgi:hypothetical protein
MVYEPKGKDSPENREKHEKILAFRQGWKDYSHATYNPKRFDHRPELKELYVRGSTECMEAINTATRTVCQEIGYDEELLGRAVLR